MSWFLLLLVVLVFASLAYVVLRRSAEQREAEHARAQAFLMEVRGGALGATTGSSPPAGDVAARANAHAAEATPAAVAASDDDAAPVSGSGRGYLDRSHQMVWRWLRTGLPACEIFARGSLRRVVGRERVDKDMRLDFVICNADFEVLGAIDLLRGGRREPAAELKRSLLSQVGVRYACWDASHLPDQAFLARWLAGDESAP